MSDIIRELEKEQLRSDLPKLEIGDTVRVYVKVVEGNRERLQNFEGIVIKMHRSFCHECTDPFDNRGQK